MEKVNGKLFYVRNFLRTHYLLLYKLFKISTITLRDTSAIYLFRMILIFLRLVFGTHHRPLYFLLIVIITDDTNVIETLSYNCKIAVFAFLC